MDAARPPYVRRTFDELSTGKPPFDVPTRIRFLRRDMGLRAFGVQILDLPPNGKGMEHDHAKDGQEELYIGLEGSGWMEIEGERLDFNSRTAIAVFPGTRRQVVAGPGGLTWLCIGGVPGRAYEPPAFFE